MVGNTYQLVVVVLNRIPIGIQFPLVILVDDAIKASKCESGYLKDLKLAQF